MRCAAPSRFSAAWPSATRTMPPDQRIEFRIGINLGDIIIDDDDIFGDGVNVAARLEGIAEPGGICVSATRPRSGPRQARFRVRRLGEQRAEEHRAAGAGLSRFLRDRKSATTVSPEPKPAACAAGQALHRCAAVPEHERRSRAGILRRRHGRGHHHRRCRASSALFVIARNSTFAYKGRAVDVKQVGRELGVRYVLEGSVRKAGKPGAHHRAAHRYRDRRPSLGGPV